MMYHGEDRVKQVNYIEQLANEIEYYGEGTGEELVSFWESQPETEQPEWYDNYDRGLLVKMIDGDFR